MRVAVTARHIGAARQSGRTPARRSPGQTLVRVETVGICGSDLHLYRDELGDSHVGLLPRIMGHEFSAIVKQADPAGSALHPAIGSRCGRCSHAERVTRAATDGPTCAPACGSSASTTTARCRSCSLSRPPTSSRHPPSRRAKPHSSNPSPSRPRRQPWPGRRRRAGSSSSGRVRSGPPPPSLRRLRRRGSRRRSGRRPARAGQLVGVRGRLGRRDESSGGSPPTVDPRGRTW